MKLKLNKALLSSILALCVAGTAIAGTTEEVTFTTSNYVGTEANAGGYNGIVFSIDTSSYNAAASSDSTSTSSSSATTEAEDYFNSDASLTLDSISLIGRYSSGASPTAPTDTDTTSYSVSAFFAYITIDGTMYTSDYCDTTTQYVVYADDGSGYYTRSLLDFDFSESGLVITTDTDYTVNFGYTVTATDLATSDITTYDVTGATIQLMADSTSNDWYFSTSSTYGNPGMTVTTSALVETWDAETGDFGGSTTTDLTISTDDYTGTDGTPTINTGSVEDGTAVETAGLAITGSGDIAITGSNGLDSTGEITVGDTDNATDVTISTAVSAAEGIAVDNGSVVVATDGSINGTDVALANGTSLTAGNMTVVGAEAGTTISMNDDGSITTDGIADTTISNAELYVTSTGNTISSSNIENTSVTMAAGSALSLSNVTIGQDTTFAIGESYTRSTVTSTTLSLTDVTIDAVSGSNLTVNGNSYTVNNIGDGLSTTVEGTLTVNLVLSDGQYDDFTSWLVDGSDTQLVFTLNGVDSYADGSLLVLTFATADTDVYYYVWGDFVTSSDASSGSLVVSLNQFNVIPEPSTATLSLLALTALLARRRRRQA